MEACGFNEPGQEKVKAEIMANHRAAVLKEKELKDTKKEAEKVKDGKASGAFNFVKPAGIMRRECLEQSNEVNTRDFAMSCVAEFMKLDGCDALRDTGKEGWPFFDWGYEGDVVKEKESKKNKGPHGLFHFLKSGVAKARPCDECADEFKKAGHCRKIKEGEQSLPIEPGCHRCGPQTLAACKVGADAFAEKRGDHVASQEMAKHNLEVKAQKKAGEGGGAVVVSDAAVEKEAGKIEKHVEQDEEDEAEEEKKEKKEHAQDVADEKAKDGREDSADEDAEEKEPAKKEEKKTEKKEPEKKTEKKAEKKAVAEEVRRGRRGKRGRRRRERRRVTEGLSSALRWDGAKWRAFFPREEEEMVRAAQETHAPGATAAIIAVAADTASGALAIGVAAAAAQILGRSG